MCDVQWSPFAARDYWVVSTANHRALVWNLNLREDSNNGNIEHSLQGHSRAITDVNFSAHHPDLLSTCSVDGYVHWWDLRRPRQPVISFCDWFAGATQVKFNRQDPHVLASAHDRFLHIWDERNSSKPLKSISAHTSKIYGIDWNRTRSTGIVTCSLDKTIRFWDYGREGNELERVIRTDYPVWRARHTPFGSGLLAMPQNEPGDLYLYDRLWSEDSPVEADANPVAVFPGHGDHKAKEFLWRSRGSISDDNIDHREFQMVSWGADNELRLHCVDAHVLASVGHIKDGPARKGLALTRQGATYKTFRTVDDGFHRDKKSGTMSDHRASTGLSQQKQSALSMGFRAGGHLSRHARQAWRGPSMKAKVDSTKTVDRSQAQLGWMKGIAMTKRKPSTDGYHRHTSREGDALGHSYPDDEWGQPDTIQEELLRISTQIPKVKWDNIDMDDLTLNASLTGPWGAEGEPIFIKVKIDIPTDYPRTRAPKFSVEKSSFMPEETHKKVTRELHELASQFLQRKQNCLEVAFTYLLGEVDLESSTTFFKNVRDLDDEIDALADESSSEDEDDAPDAQAVSLSQELPHADADTTLAPVPHRNVIPPPPRTCGARFSHDGRLVCFLPSKEEKARALFSSSAEMQSRERAKGEPFFAGFGRLTYEMPSRQKYMTDEVSVTEGPSDDSGSDMSSSSSSDSDTTSIHKMNLWYSSSKHLRRAWSEDRSMRSSAGGTGTGVGTGTGTGTGASRRRYGRPRNLIVIHDLRADLPSKREYAEEYAIFGDGADVCEHNARVAEKHGNADLVDIWHYLGLLLTKGIPLEVLGRNRRNSSVLVIARDALGKSAQDALSGFGVSVGGDPGLLGRVKWGRHPLAKEFIMDLFDYFAKIADVQMLAMMSCIFSEPLADDGIAYAKSQLPQQETPLPLKAPSFSLSYFPTDSSLWNLQNQSHSNSAVTTPAALQTPVLYPGSHGSDEFLWSGDAGAGSYSNSETPPTHGKSYLAEAEAASQPASRSPTSRGILRGNTGLATAFNAALPKAFAGGNVSSSPPSATQPRKRPSPAEYIINSLAPGTGSTGQPTPGTTATSGDSGGGHTSISGEDNRKDGGLPLIPIAVSVAAEDQTVFDDDGWLSAPLLDPGHAIMFTKYRHAYAEMLQMWQQPLARLEVMKFNVLRDESSMAIMDGAGSLHDSLTLQDGIIGHHKTGSSPIAMGKKDQLHNLIASGRGLDVTGICRVHETQLEPARYTVSGRGVGGAVGKCDRCHRMQGQLRCVYCLEPVDALFPPCLSCGCASHESCLAEWHAAGETLCPAGDECNCVKEAANGQVESWAALRGAMMKGHASKMSLLPPAAIEDDDEEGDDKAEGDDEHEDDNGGRRGASDWDRVEMFLPGRVQEDMPVPSAVAALSLGRLKKSGTWSSRPSSLRKSKRP